MIKELAYEFIKGRMEKLGYAKDGYYIDFLHAVMQPGEHRDYEAYNEFFLLAVPVDNINITSDFGFFDLSFNKVDELQYWHQGFISVHNYSTSVNHVQFIQVIPILKSKEN